MENKIEAIKNWLGTGSINVFGIQYSGKDTVGKKLAEALGATFIASGDIVRASGDRLNNKEWSDVGRLTNPVEYKVLIADYIAHELPAGALILGSFGRHTGEEDLVIESLIKSGHPTKAVLSIYISEEEVWQRWEMSKELRDRGERVDELSEETVRTRIEWFRDKTLPVVDVYRQMGLLIEINGQQSREAVLAEVVDKLYEFVQKRV
ncbi:nucleoside monophosphate kinase [Candidatus Saccharibacteria bacterium]|nr:nucleoside monophosphate kinase [Candidatus Saccharibacteria bacterium]